MLQILKFGVIFAMDTRRFDHQLNPSSTFFLHVPFHCWEGDSLVSMNSFPEELAET